MIVLTFQNFGTGFRGGREDEMSGVPFGGCEDSSVLFIFKTETKKSKKDQTELSIV